VAGFYCRNVLPLLYVSLKVKERRLGGFDSPDNLDGLHGYYIQTPQNHEPQNKAFRMLWLKLPCSKCLSMMFSLFECEELLASYRLC
jgi:hypothetical protein